MQYSCCQPQARRLLNAGYEVTVWNRSADRCEPLKQDGAQVASSAEEAVAGADITVAMLADPPAALAVAKDAAKGLSKGQSPALASIQIMTHIACSSWRSMRASLMGAQSAGKGYVDASTVDPGTAQQIAEVTVTPHPAGDGSCTICICTTTEQQTICRYSERQL